MVCCGCAIKVAATRYLTTDKTATAKQKAPVIRQEPVISMLERLDVTSTDTHDITWGIKTA